MCSRSKHYYLIFFNVTNGIFIEMKTKKLEINLGL